MKPVKALLKAGENRRIRKMEKIVTIINSLEEDMETLTDAQLRAKTDEFKERILAGDDTVDTLVPESFAVVREAAKRVIGQRPYDVQLLGGLALHNGNIAEMRTGEGKAVTCTTRIPTPNGWTTADEVKVGDQLFDREGHPTQVTGVFPQGKQTVYEIELADGRTVQCNKDHLWSVYENGQTDTTVTLTTGEMLHRGVKNDDGNFRYRLPQNGQVKYPETDHVFSPYIVGAVLGTEGSTHPEKVFLSTADIRNAERTAAFLGAKNFTYNTDERNQHNRSGNDWFSRVMEKKEPSPVSAQSTSATAVLTRDDEHAKNDTRIPAEYKIVSVRQRWELVQGLMDTAGGVVVHADGSGEDYCARFVTVSEHLRDDFMEVVRSLGYSCTWSSGETVTNRYGRQETQYVVNVQVDREYVPFFFSLPWKTEIVHGTDVLGSTRENCSTVAVVTIKELPYEEEQVCFTVANEEKLFLVGDYVVTHNTLVATLPSYANALSGKGVHVVTVNDYLAQRDSEWMGRIHQFLGLTVGCIVSDLPIQERQAAYAADITYGTNNEFGFDYLRDNMSTSLGAIIQRGHNYAIVDEADSILIDEARTPLIISGPSDIPLDWYANFAKLVSKMEKDVDYTVDVKQRQIAVLEPGVDKVEDDLGIDNLYSAENTNLVGHFINAIKAKELFQRDKEYIVTKEKKAVIVDEHTGRTLADRRYNDGIHQAIEAKEHITIQEEYQTLATVTLQNYFRLYDKLAGMTGTATSEAAEFVHTYSLNVIPIPTHRPNQREDEHDVVYQTEAAKFAAVAQDIKQAHEKGQPVLVGTTSVEKSELLSRLLKEEKIPHHVLNAKNNQHEALIVADAGREGAVTVATNMAGRGTDIVLGGNPEHIATRRLEKKEVFPPTPEEVATSPDVVDTYNEVWTVEVGKAKKEVAAEHERIIGYGGLYVIGTERHESRRIDNQLRGRSGRQGDPGKTQFYLSFEDELVKKFNLDMAQNLLARLNLPEDVPLQAKLADKLIETAQTQMEARNFDTRKNVLKYDDVMDVQRKTVYMERNQILHHANMTPHIIRMIRDTLTKTAQKHTSEGYFEDWDLDALVADMKLRYPSTVTAEKIRELNKESLASDRKDDLDADAVADIFIQDATGQYREKTSIYGKSAMQKMERQVLLASLDRRWKEHLHEMDYLKSGIGLRGFAQKDPITEYRQEGYELFHLMLDTVKEETTKYVFYIHPHTGATQFNRDDSTRNGNEAAGTEIFGIKPIDPAKQNKFLEETETDFPLFFNLDEVDKMLGSMNTAADVPAGDVPGFSTNTDESDRREGLVFSGPSETSALEEELPILQNRTEKRVDAQVGERGNPDRPSSAGVQIKYVADDDTVEEKYRGVAKNAKCPCGSGKKFKRCHGAELFTARA